MPDSVKQKRFDLFEVLPSEEWEKMSRMFPVVEFEDKSPIYHQGEKCGIISLISQRQQFLEQKLESLVFKDVQARLAETLYELAGHYGEKCPHGFELDIRLTQQELADLVCAGRPVVSTLLNQFRDQGILAYDRDFICINQIENFKNLINV